jgi:3-hydroxyisobutyrate dehydrogenase
LENTISAGLTVGFIGLGDMGGAIAGSLVRNGVDLVAFDLRPEPVARLVAMGARAAESLAALAEASDVAFVVVVDDKQVNDVVGRLFAHPGRLHTIVISSTVLPSTVIALGEKAKQQGLHVIDAPVSGGAEKASRGIITVMVGGEDEAVRRCWPIFEAFGKHLFHVGPAGAGSAGKLVNNLLSLGGNILQLEAMQLAHAYGISEDSVTEFVAVSAGDSRALHTWGRIDRVRRSHTIGGTPEMYEMFSKDVKTATLAAGQRGITLPVAAVIGATTAEKMRIRDEFLEANAMTGAIPRCTICGQELASSYRAAAVHPECAYDPESASGR